MMNVKYHNNQFPPKIQLDDEIHKLINQARTELGRYDGFLSSMVNSQVLLSPLFTQEAVLSSKIEGTQSTLTEVLEFEAYEGKQNITEAKRNDIREVLNYRYALNTAVELLKTLPLSKRVFLACHKELMKNARGKNKVPDEYRKTPVWIGGSSFESARFIPIDANKIPQAMSDFEKYLHNSDEYDDLIKIAILHAEFEAIHPFLDGNGRLGRLLIPLYLWKKDLLSSQSFYMSTYFENDRDSYYDGLLDVSKNENWLDWCKYFLKGVISQSKQNLNRARKITQLYNDLKIKIPTLTKSQYGITALDFIFKVNYFKSTTFYERSKIPKPTARRLLKTLVEKEILQYTPGSGRIPNFYIFKQLIDMADGK